MIVRINDLTEIFLAPSLNVVTGDYQVDITRIGTAILSPFCKGQEGSVIGGDNGRNAEAGIALRTTFKKIAGSGMVWIIR